ncbi:MAG: nuclear transport factor 2 family protein [Flavobacteriaceae bacterium]|nr:nuclear transport factor 2 family protein [Flavobacteriaceae bacterium]
MKNQSNVFVIFSLLIFMASCNNTPCPEPEAHAKEIIDKEQLKAEIEELFVKTQSLMSEKDVEGLVQRFTADGKLKLPQSPLIQGHDALRENYKTTTQLEDFKIDIKTLDVEISEAGDMASVVGEFTVSFNTPQGTVQDNGVTLLTLKRIDNSWKIAAEVLSSFPQEM